MFFDPDATWDERRCLEMFRRDVLPVIERRGAEIGQRAMQGDGVAERLIRRYHVFSCWLDPVNLAMLTDDLRAYELSREGR